MSLPAPASRTKEIRKLRAAGLTYKQIGKIVGLSRQRIFQILSVKNGKA